MSDMPSVSSVEVWVLRNRNPQTVSGQECSSTTRKLLCAAGMPGGAGCRRKSHTFWFDRERTVLLCYDAITTFNTHIMLFDICMMKIKLFSHSHPEQ